ncbi:MAG TPA: serine/threonine protein phosphatase [Clostridiaceae bacterium]|nr:serine/threonine protein phosphatase [Clostridiaceae bacterium]
MSIFAVSDLHLSGVNPKPMDIFGQKWQNHWDKIKNAWQNSVKKDDTVLIPGDISWAMSLKDAMYDINDISKMPGKKIFLRGNHDYWWASPAKLKRTLPENIDIIQNNNIELDDYYICGTRGWILPGDERFKTEDEKIYKREIIRLKLSFSSIPANPAKAVIVMMHFPPVNEKREASEFIDIMKEHKTSICVYGHLHNANRETVVEGLYEGIRFHLVSCDYLDFKLKKIV